MICGVTGASGFAGSRLLARLAQEKRTVRALVRNTSNLSDISDFHPQLVYGDVGDPEAVDRFVEGCDAVYHVAALYREAAVPDSEYFRVNLKGTENVVKSCLKHRVKKLVHCSTIGVLGHIVDPPADETTPYAPGDAYQRSKCEGEKLVLRFCREEGLPAAVVRPAAIYGPGDTRLLKLFRLIASGRFVMIGSGKVYYHLAYIDNLVDGFLLAGDSDRSVGQVYIVADERYVPLWNLVYSIADEVGVKRPYLRIPARPVQWLGSLVQAVCVPFGIDPPIHRRRVDFFTKSRAFRIDKAKTELGYQPKVGLEEGIRRTARWYREKGLL
jgi:nucleoside-diphosphate-sugar epimerase